MSLSLYSYVMGPLENNAYLVVDDSSKKAFVVDPSFNPDEMIDDARGRGFIITKVLLTHGHFDHIAGIRRIAEVWPSVEIAIHASDLPLYLEGGGAAQFGWPFEPFSRPGLKLEDGQAILLGDAAVIVRHTPGHTPGHVVFTCQEEKVAICGDLIFAGSVGRTDLPGGNYDQLIESIQKVILTLPPDTRLFSGHGPETTVGEEILSNPFLS